MRSHAQKASHFSKPCYLAESGSVEALGDCFVSSIVCSPVVTPDGRRDSLQGVGCGKVVLKCLINMGTGRYIILEDASASMFSTPVMRDMDAWILSWLVIHAAFWRRGLVAMLMLPRLAHLSKAVFLTPAVM